MKLSDLNDEYMKIMRECEQYLYFKKNQATMMMGSGSSGDQQLQQSQRVLLRVEELEDLVVELKNQSSTNEIVELKELLLLKESEVAALNTKIGEMCKQRLGIN